ARVSASSTSAWPPARSHRARPSGRSTPTTSATSPASACSRRSRIWQTPRQYASIAQMKRADQLVRASYWPERRTFLVMISGALLAAPLAAQGQQPAKVPRVGYLSTGLVANTHNTDAFRQGLRELGYVEGKNIVIEYRAAEGKLERFPALAAELVAVKVDVIVAANTQAALAAKQATRTIPIVFASPPDPVSSGLVASLARPGGNLTGLSSLPTPELIGKNLELLKQAVPEANRVVALWHRDYPEPAQNQILGAPEAAARALG